MFEAGIVISLIVICIVMRGVDLLQARAIDELRGWRKAHVKWHEEHRKGK